MTVTLMRGSDLIGRVVVDASTGDDLAEIKDVVFSTDRGAITGFTLRRRGMFRRRLKTVLPVGAVSSVGTDAVMVAHADAISEPEDAPDDMSATESNDVLRDEVYTTSGRLLGTFDPVAGKHGGPQPVPGDPRGTTIIDLHGDKVGTIADMTITDAGLVDTILMADGHSLHGTRLQVIGTYAAIVSVDSP